MTSLVKIEDGLVRTCNLVPTYTYIKIVTTMTLRFKLEVIIIVHYRKRIHMYPDIVIKRYSNNGRIVDADDEYLSTSEWRCTNRLFRIEQIQ